VKRRDLLKRLEEIADTELVRHGGSHDIYCVGNVQVTIPRHNEINEITAKAIIKEAQSA
jgi:predicted RNA binding protein YcfA (HicA-like mRNA interferase family)